MTFIQAGTAAFGLHDRNRDVLSALRRRLDVANRELATGLRDDAHAALGGRAAQSLSLRAAADRERGQKVANLQLEGRLEMAADVMGSVRAALEGFLEVAVPNEGEPGPTVAAVGLAARSALDAVVQRLNATFGGSYLFSGIETESRPLHGWQEPRNPGGHSPGSAIEALIGAGPFDGADAAAAVARIADAFDIDGGSGAFEDVFYGGAARATAAGVPTPRVSAAIGGGATLAHGFQANDAPVVEALRGLSMVIARPPDEIADPAAYEVWMGAALAAVEDGVDGIRTAEARLGAQQTLLATHMGRQDALIRVYDEQVLALEGVDPYEAANRVVQLRDTLEASYAATSAISSLSYLDFMR